MWWWLSRASRVRRHEFRRFVWERLAAGKEPAAILDDLTARGADTEGAVLIYTQFRWERYPWWVRWSSVFGSVQTRRQAKQWVLIWALFGAVLVGTGMLGLRDPSREFGARWLYLLLAAVAVAVRVVWRWRAIAWIDRHGSWLFAGLTMRQLRQLVREAQNSTAEPARRVTPSGEPPSTTDPARDDGSRAS
jgi:hypothetical protein